jgi:hemoglobin
VAEQGAGDDTSREVTVHELVGGTEAFVELVDRFYERVEQDAPLRAVYPEDLGPGKRALALFLAQYWGGPTTYSDRRGHPRLRMRHAPYAVTPLARDRWLHHFRAGLDAADLTPEQDQRFWEYAHHAAMFMVNTMDESAQA